MLERELKFLTREDETPQYDTIADWFKNVPDEVYLAVVRTPECVLRYLSRADDVLFDGEVPAYIRATEAFTDRHKLMLEKDEGYRKEFEEKKEKFEKFVKAPGGGETDENDL